MEKQGENRKTGGRAERERKKRGGEGKREGGRKGENCEGQDVRFSRLPALLPISRLPRSKSGAGASARRAFVICAPHSASKENERTKTRVMRNGTRQTGMCSVWTPAE